MPDRLTVRLIDGDGRLGRAIGSLTRTGTGVTRRGLVAGDILDGIMDRWELNAPDAFDRLKINGWCNGRVTLDPDE